MEAEARETLTDAQLTVAVLWSRGASVTSIAEGTKRTRQAASKSLRIVRTKLQAFSDAIS